MMTLPFYALSLLCALAAVVLVAAPEPSRRSHTAAAALLFLGAGWTAWSGVPPVQVVGCLAAAGAAAFLLRPAWAATAAGIGGVLAGVWSGILATQGLPRWVAVPLACTVLAVSMRARHYPEFAPPQLRDEALVLVCALALGVAMLPGFLDGWGAAQSLTAQPGDLQRQMIPTWALAMTGSSLGLGASYAVWSRR
ncbi:MAG: hypothetical protein O2930_02650 [Acidobacteria bacterium]|nr:hypothetical protein [Acidobacteriota bacterium]